MTHTLRKPLLALTTIAALGLTGYAVAGNYILEYVYYSDASHTTIVGESVTRCDNSTYVTGTITPYKRLVGHEPCAFSRR
ncbi:MULTISPECIES: DUF6289 family protein [Ferrimonas]|uniref:DUF6289 family protein n=1 Tax=Ferrimonas TaxID=44011 RepID=UPI0004276742|nr:MULTISPECIES: DUF6289 family protein [Ferrimonas]USD37229.1 hypothetical protein J8Z22_19970 [Ferrimonas sp. SCSIO 43195]